MAEHGFLQPNPALFSLDQKPRAVLGHEEGQGATCGDCGPDCPGFQLHYWKKGEQQAD